MRFLIGALVAGGLLAGCDQTNSDNGELRATSTIPEATDSAGQDSASTGHDNAIAQRAQPGPRREEEAGFGINAGLVRNNLPRSDFENFLMGEGSMGIERNVASSDGRMMTADRLDMDFNSFVGLYRSDAGIESGTRFSGEITLWAETGDTADVVLQIVDYCSSNGTDIGTERVAINDEPTQYRVSHTFSGQHDCALFLVTNVTEGGAVIFADSAALRED